MENFNQEHFLVSFAKEIDRLSNLFVFDGYSALASFLQAPLASLIVLYIVLMGYAIARGMVDKPMNELLRFAFRVGIIYMTAMNWSFFAEHIKDLFVVGSESISSKLMLAVNKQSTAGSINQGLQNVLDEISMLAFDLFDKGSMRKFSPYFAGIMVFISGSVTVAFAFIEIIVAKLMISITLATAPLFIIFTLFDQTKSLFERWLGLIISFSFVLIFVSSVVGLCVHLLHWITAPMLHSSSSLTAAVWIPLFIVAVFCFVCISQAVSMGKSIGSALCTSSGQQMVGDFKRSVSGLAQSTARSMGKAKSGLKGVSNIAGKSSGLGASANVIKQMHKNLRGSR